MLFFSFIYCNVMTSSSYGRVFCLESQKIDGTESAKIGRSAKTDRPILRFFLYY